MRRKTIRRIADEVARRMVPVEPPDPATLVRLATLLHVGVGDVVVLHAPDGTAPIVADRLKKAAAEVFAPARVLVLSESLRLSVAGDDHPENGK